MFIVIATQKNNTSRAFLFDTKRKAENCKKDLIINGWFNIYIQELDNIMIGTIGLNTSHLD